MDLAEAVAKERDEHAWFQTDLRPADFNGKQYFDEQDIEIAREVLGGAPKMILSIRRNVSPIHLASSLSQLWSRHIKLWEMQRQRRKP